MDIPEDVLREARIALSGWTIDDGTAFQFDQCAASVANAILAERKRCADVARSLNGWGPVGGNKVAEHIATIIESGQ